MPPVQYKICSLKGQSWEIINVYEFMKRETERKINEMTSPKLYN
jgi:hypothetical protein